MGRVAGSPNGCARASGGRRCPTYGPGRPPPRARFDTQPIRPRADAGTQPRLATPLIPANQVRLPVLPRVSPAARADRGRSGRLLLVSAIFEPVTAAEVQEALAVDELLGDRLVLQYFLLGQLAVDPVALGGEESRQLVCGDVLGRPQSQATRPARSSGWPCGWRPRLDGYAHAVEVKHGGSWRCPLASAAR